MSIVLVNDFAVGDVNLTAMMETLNITYKGKSEVTLSNYDNDTAPDIKVGSVFDCNGAIFSVTSSDETPSGYSGIANDTMFYLIYSVGLNEFIYTATAPTWSDSKQGWYDGNNRYFFSMYKDSGGTLYYGKKDFVNEPWYFCITGKYTYDVLFLLLRNVLPLSTLTDNHTRNICGRIGANSAFRLYQYFEDPTEILVAYLSNNSVSRVTIASIGGGPVIVHIYATSQMETYQYSL